MNVFELRCPEMREAMRLWWDGLKYRQENDNFIYMDEYIFHTQGVAFASRAIAGNIKGLNPETAYICGLLHDYGKKYNEKKIGQFHGLVGYKELMSLGWERPARTCLTHTFPEKNIILDDYPSYPQKDLLEAQKILNDVVFDEYDRIVQFADRLFEGLSMIPFEERAKAIGKRYGLKQDIVQKLINTGQALKEELSGLCEKDVYEILGLK